jgi:nucleotide-binding universal stress UspA family protein
MQGDRQGPGFFRRRAEKEKKRRDAMRVHFRNILCATDFSEYSNLTIDYGTALAREFGAALVVCHVIDLSSVAIYGEFQLDPVGQQARIKEDAEQQLAAMLGHLPVRWEPLITVGKPAEEIARIVEEKQIDLVLSATRRRSGLKRLILGSVTEQLMRTLTCPLLVVHSPSHEFIDPRDQRVRLKKILIGCDFSDDSRLALSHGLSLAQEFESELHLVHVIEPPVYQDLVKAKPATPQGIKDNVLSDLLTKKLQALVPEEVRNWCSLHTILLEGPPYEELVAYAERNAVDMIVLGVRGYGLVKSLLVGSTTDRVMRHAPCPVLSVSNRSNAEGLRSLQG